MNCGLLLVVGGVADFVHNCDGQGKGISLFFYVKKILAVAWRAQVEAFGSRLRKLLFRE